MSYVGTEDGLISELGDVSFKNNEAIEWDITIQGDWTRVDDDGEIES